MIVHCFQAFGVPEECRAWLYKGVTIDSSVASTYVAPSAYHAAEGLPEGVDGGSGRRVSLLVFLLVFFSFGVSPGFVRCVVTDGVCVRVFFSCVP